MESNPPNPSTSPRGLTLFIRSWLPLFTTPIRGHNQSSGLEAFVPNVNLVVDDCLIFFKFITTQNAQFQSLSKFLFEESMDDMICFLIHFKNPSSFNEAILIAPIADVMNDPDVSRELYEQAKSKDKTLKIYDGMMHSSLFGETDENVEIVWSDIL
ncbi:hypothetical protein ACSBR1_043024 [Camellia fascicularis]